MNNNTNGSNGSDTSRHSDTPEKKERESYGYVRRDGESEYSSRLNSSRRNEDNNSEYARRKNGGSEYQKRISGSRQTQKSESLQERGGGSSSEHRYYSGSSSEHRHHSSSGSSSEHRHHSSSGSSSEHRHHSSNSSSSEHRHHHSSSGSSSSKSRTSAITSDKNIKSMSSALQPLYTGLKSKIDMRSAISILFAFLLSILFVCGSILCIIQSAISSKTVERLTLNAEYLSLIKQEIYENALDYTLPTGIETIVLDNAFRESDIEQDLQEEVKCAFEGEEDYTPAAYSLKKRLKTNVEAYFETIDVSLDSENNAQIIQEYVDDIVEIYKTGIKVAGLKYLVKAGNKFKTYSALGLIAIILLSAYLIVLVTKIHHYLHHALIFITYSAGATALMMFTAPFIVWASKGYKRIGITPQSFYHLVVSWIEDILKMFFNASLIWILIAAALGALIWYFTGKSDSKRRIKRYIKKKTVEITDKIFGFIDKIQRLFNR